MISAKGAMTVKTMFCAKGLYIASGVLLCALGVLFLCLPDTMLRILCIILGALMLLFAGAKIVGYFSKDPYGLAFQFDLALGVTVAFLGAIFLLRKGMTINTVAVAVGLFVLIDGAFKLQTAIDAKRFGMRAWWLILSGAIITDSVAAILIFFPAEAVHALTNLVGVALIVDSAQNLYNTFYTVRTMRNLHKERFVSVLEDDIRS